MPRKPREVTTMDEADRAAEEIMGKKKPKRRKRFTEAGAKGKRAGDSRRRDVTAHATRAAETRQAQEGHESWDEPWVRSGTLPEIPARTGMVQRWIRVAMRGENDATNTSRKFREGWRPRKADSLPKNFIAPTIQGGAYAGCIGVEGMLLCEMPRERNDQRNAYFARRKKTQTDAVNQQLAEASRHGSPAFGRIQKAEKTEVGRLREVVTQEDDL